MNQKKSYTHELRLDILKVIWVQHSGYLDTITKEFGVRFYFQQNVIVLVGNQTNCLNAAQKICQMTQEDFLMLLEEFQSYDEIQPFHQLFQLPQYRNLSKSIQGFWIYTPQSLMKQYFNMEQKGYKASFPEFPQHFLITWFPRKQMDFIQQQIFQMIGYRYNQQVLKEHFQIDKQYNITALEAISIYLILDIQDIMDSLQLKLELKQLPNQYFLVIKANNRASVEQTLSILENHLEIRKFWSIAYLEIQLSPNDLFYLEKNINHQVRTQFGIKIYTYEDVMNESQRLDKQFDINLNEILIQRHNSDSLFVYGEEDKQIEITDKTIQIVRKMRQNNKIDQEDRIQQQFCYKDIQNDKFQKNIKKFQQSQYSQQNKLKRIQYDQFTYHDQKQFDQRPIKYSQNYFTNNVHSSMQDQSSKQQYSKYNYKDEKDNNQLDLPLKDYKRYQKTYNNNYSKRDKNNFKKFRSQNPEQLPYNQSQQRDEDFSLYVVKTQQINNFNYTFRYSQQYEEEKSQILQIEALNKLIQCSVIKIELHQYQILYSQTDNKTEQKINFRDFKESFEEFKQQYYNLSPEINLEFNPDNIKMNVKFKQQEDIDSIKKIFNKYFLQSMYYVTQFSTQALGLIDILKQNCKVVYFATKTDLCGLLKEDEFKALEKIEDGQQIAIEINNYSYRHHKFLSQKLTNFEIQLSFYQNSSILDISRQGINSKKVIIISENQLNYLRKEFEDLETCKLKKFKEFFKMSFYFVQIENNEEMLEMAKIEFQKMNEQYVKEQVQLKQKENKKQWMKLIKKEESYQVSKIYCYNMMEAFNIKLFNDINDIQLNTEEYQANYNISMFQEKIIELRDQQLNPDDPESLQNLLFSSNFRFEPKEIQQLDLPAGIFITLWIRKQRNDMNDGDRIQQHDILPRGYIQKK